MKNLDEVKGVLSRHKQELREKYGVTEIGVFGSYARGRQKKQSDIDLLVELDESSNLTLLGFVRLEDYLSELLGVKVDLVEKHVLKQRIGQHVLAEVVNV
jgi:uncharacterized protein